MDFTGKVVLVTGASAGIGESTALEFARLGARLALVGRNEPALRAVAERCAASRGQAALPIAADLATDAGVERVAAHTIQHFGRLDVLVNNAAVGARTTIIGADMETFDRVFAVNIRSVYNLTRLLVPELIKTKGNIVNVSSIMGTMVALGALPYSMTKVRQSAAAVPNCTSDVLVNNAAVGSRTKIIGADMETFDRVFAVNIRSVYNLTRLLVPELIKTKGNIVNISSILATSVAVGNLIYSMSKAALDHFSRIIAYELAPKGVRVNVVSPGITISTFVQRVTGYTDEEYKSWLAKTERGIPLGRASTGDDCAKIITHMASDACAVVTGVVVPVDGGLQFVGAGGNSEILKDQVEQAKKL